MRKLRLESDALPQFAAIVGDSARDHRFYVSDVMNVLERIAIHKNHIGTLPYFNRSGFSIKLHYSRGNNRGSLNRFHGSKTGVDVQFHFAIEAVSRNALIRARDDWNSRAMQRARELAARSPTR